MRWYLKHVALVHRAQLAAALSSRLKADAGDTVDLSHREDRQGKIANESLTHRQRMTTQEGKGKSNGLWKQTLRGLQVLPLVLNELLMIS